MMQKLWTSLISYSVRFRTFRYVYEDPESESVVVSTRCDIEVPVNQVRQVQPGTPDGKGRVATVSSTRRFSGGQWARSERWHGGNPRKTGWPPSGPRSETRVPSSSSNNDKESAIPLVDRKQRRGRQSGVSRLTGIVGVSSGRMA